MNNSKIANLLKQALNHDEKSGFILQMGMARLALSLNEKPTMATIAQAFGEKSVPVRGEAIYDKLNYQQKIASKYFALFDSATTKAFLPEKIDAFKAVLSSLDFEQSYANFDITPVKQWALMQGFVLRCGADFTRCVLKTFEGEKPKPAPDNKPKTTGKEPAGSDVASNASAEAESALDQVSAEVQAIQKALSEIMLAGGPVSAALFKAELANENSRLLVLAKEFEQYVKKAEAEKATLSKKLEQYTTVKPETAPKVKKPLNPVMVQKLEQAKLSA